MLTCESNELGVYTHVILLVTLCSPPQSPHSQTSALKRFIFGFANHFLMCPQILCSNFCRTFRILACGAVMIAPRRLRATTTAVGPATPFQTRQTSSRSCQGSPHPQVSQARLQSPRPHRLHRWLFRSPLTCLRSCESPVRVSRAHHRHACVLASATKVSVEVRA